MGCDAPLGGPVKLLRKVAFIPPSVGDHAPRLYTPAFDMSRGLRVVVVFGEKIMLYSIPPDVCEFSRAEKKAESWSSHSVPLFANEEECSGDQWTEWWNNTTSRERENNASIWPIAVRGQQIGILKGVCEVTITTRPDITIWAFTVYSQ